MAAMKPISGMNTMARAAHFHSAGAADLPLSARAEMGFPRFGPQ